MASESKDDCYMKKELDDIHRSSDFSIMSPRKETVLYERDGSTKNVQKTVSYSDLQEKVFNVFTQMQEFINLPTFNTHVRKEVFKMNDFDTQLETRKKDLKKDCAVIFAGETSAGKSTVINLWIDEKEPLLPVDITATTSRLCRIKYSEDLELAAKDEENKIIIQKEFPADKKADMVTSLEDLAMTDESEVRYIDISLPVPILQGNIMIVDTPGIGDKAQEDVANMMMEYLPNAVAFVFVVNMANAGGLQDDRLPRILTRVRQLMHQMHCFDPKDSIFLLNKWDTLILANRKTDLFEETKIKLRKMWKEVDDNCILKFAAAKISEDRMYKEEFEIFQEILRGVITKNENKRIKEHFDFIIKFIDECELILSAKLKFASQSTEENERTFDHLLKELEKIESERKKASFHLHQNIDMFLGTTAKRLHNYIHGTEFKATILKGIKKCSRLKLGTELDTRIEKETRSWQEENIEDMFEKEVVQNLMNKSAKIQRSLKKFKGMMSGFTFHFDAKKSMFSFLISNLSTTGPALLKMWVTMFSEFPKLTIAVTAAGLLSGIVYTRINLDDFETAIENAYSARIKTFTEEKIEQFLNDSYGKVFRELINHFLDGDLKKEIQNLRDNVDSMSKIVDSLKTVRSELRSLISELSEIKTRLKDFKNIDIKFG